MTIHVAKSIEEAVELAERFRAEGRYDLFRGQREDWPLTATLARLPEAQRDAAAQRLQKFFAWLARQPEVAALADRNDPAAVDQKIALAQHYGLPTLFCDFTAEPRVAGFFAASNGAAGPSVIVCCHSDTLAADARALGTGAPHLKVLRIAVPNLWRLEAQAGVFLFLPFEDVESHLRFDRIVFPGGPYAGISAADIYPQRRSRLEVLMDQYFGFELERARHDRLMATPDLRIIVPPGALAMMAETALGGDPGPHPSWQAAPPAWRSHPVAPWQADGSTTRLHLCDDLRAEPSAVGAQVHERVLHFLAAGPHARQTAVTLTADPPEFAGIVKRAQWLWDGLRPFPCTDDQLATAIANLAMFGSVLARAHRAGAPRSAHVVASALWPQAMEVEFGRAAAPPARGFVDAPALFAAVRPDFAALLKPEYRSHAEDVAGVINVMPAPSRAFAFEPFAQVFVTQVVPSQVFFSAAKAHYFSPLELEVFGHP